jgi:DNA invertase Pin-like site-specific DNA recombinase
LATQEARIRTYAELVGIEITEVIVDAGVSGTKALASRDGGKRVMALLDARKPHVDAVIVLRLDRLGRDAAEQLALLKRFRTGKVGLVSVNDRVDLATPHGRAMAQVGIVFAELERALIAQRTAETLRTRRDELKPWNHAPFGWRVEGADRRKLGGEDTRKLVPVESEQTTLTRMRELRDEGMSYNRIAGVLADEGHATKRGGKWAAMTVRETLRAQPDIASAV